MKYGLQTEPNSMQMQLFKDHVLRQLQRDTISEHLTGHPTGKYSDARGDHVDAFGKLIRALVEGSGKAANQHTQRIARWVERQDWDKMRALEERFRPTIIEVIEDIWGHDERAVSNDFAKFMNLKYDQSVHKCARRYLDALTTLANSVQRRLPYQNKSGTTDTPSGGAHGEKGFLPTVRVLERFLYGLPETTRSAVEEEMHRERPHGLTIYSAEWRGRSVENRELKTISYERFEELVRRACTMPGTVKWEDRDHGSAPHNNSGTAAANKPGKKWPQVDKDAGFVPEFKQFDKKSKVQKQKAFKEAKENFWQHKNSGTRDPGALMARHHVRVLRFYGLCTTSGKPRTQCPHGCTTCTKRKGPAGPSPTHFNQIITSTPTTASPSAASTSYLPATTQYVGTQPTLALPAPSVDGESHPGL